MVKKKNSENETDFLRHKILDADLLSRIAALLFSWHEPNFVLQQSLTKFYQA